MDTSWSARGSESGSIPLRDTEEAQGTAPYLVGEFSACSAVWRTICVCGVDSGKDTQTNKQKSDRHECASCHLFLKDG